MWLIAEFIVYFVGWLVAETVVGLVVHAIGYVITAALEAMWHGLVNLANWAWEIVHRPRPPL